MLSRKADGPLTVQIPGPAEDRPSWTRVGVIAAVGFIVGVAWPRLAGVRMGPSVPEAATASAAAAAPPSEAAPAFAGAGGTAPPTTGVPAVVAAPVAAPAASIAVAATVNVGHGVIFACKTSEGDSLKGGECGSLPGLDGIVMSRLRKLADCPEASGATGKLHLVVHVDFPRGGLAVDLGRGHGVSSPDALLACAKSAISGAGLNAVVHENPRYSVAYSVTFASEGAAVGAPSAGGSASARTGAGGGGDTAEGTAQVVWEVAIVRDAPKSGKVVARLQHGAELRLGAVKDGWYPVKFGEGFTSEGWVYRGAIGR